MQLTDLASRYENIVKDKLENDYLVIFDRYIDTGIVRALARGMNSNFIYKSFSIFDKPDVSFLLDIPSDLACERKLPNTNQAWMIGMNQLEIPNTFDRDGYVHYQEKCRLLYLNQMNRNDCVILNGKLNTKHLYEIALKKIISLGAKG
jgi:thymidylate kinase